MSRKQQPATYDLGATTCQKPQKASAIRDLARGDGKMVFKNSGFWRLASARITA